MNLVESSIDENQVLISESSSSFLPSKKDGSFDAYEFLNKHSQREDVLLFILKNDEGNLVGYISVLVKSPKQVDIGPMYIKSDFQGRGYGKQQVELLVNWLKEHGYRKIATQTWGENSASRKIFEALGFKLTESVEGTRINGDSSIKYILEV